MNIFHVYPIRMEPQDLLINIMVTMFYFYGYRLQELKLWLRRSKEGVESQHLKTYNSNIRAIPLYILYSYKYY